MSGYFESVIGGVRSNDPALTHIDVASAFAYCGRPWGWSSENSDLLVGALNNAPEVLKRLRLLNLLLCGDVTFENYDQLQAIEKLCIAKGSAKILDLKSLARLSYLSLKHLNNLVFLDLAGLKLAEVSINSNSLKILELPDLRHLRKITIHGLEMTAVMKVFLKQTAINNPLIQMYLGSVEIKSSPMPTLTLAMFAQHFMQLQLIFNLKPVPLEFKRKAIYLSRLEVDGKPLPVQLVRSLLESIDGSPASYLANHISMLCDTLPEGTPDGAVLRSFLDSVEGRSYIERFACATTQTINASVMRLAARARNADRQEQRARHANLLLFREHRLWSTYIQTAKAERPVAKHRLVRR